MKITCFYLVRNMIDSSKYYGVLSDTIKQLGDKECSLYAFTPEKQSADYFRTTRNMRLFYEKTYTMEREDYEEFCDDNKDYLLEYHSMTTKVLQDGVYCYEMIQVLATVVESDCILYYKNDYFIEYMNKILSFPLIHLIRANVLDPDITHILDKVFCFQSISFQIVPMEDSNIEDYDIDELALYIKLFSNTMKK